MSLVELLGVALVMGILLLGANRMMQSFSKQQTQAVTTTSILSISRNFQTILKSPAVWNKTFNHANNGPAFQCLKDTPPDCQSKWDYDNGKPKDTEIKLYDQNNVLVYDRLGNPTTGYTNSGSTCNAFSSSGNDKCPFQLVLRWGPSSIPSGCPNPIGAPSACLSPTPHIKGHFDFKPSADSRNLAFNSANYDFDVAMDGSGGGGGAGSAIPSGAVMAFNLAACPTGWTALTGQDAAHPDMRGHTAVGTGTGTECTTLDATGKCGVASPVANLSARALRDHGGEEKHKLMVPELARHKHTDKGHRHKTLGNKMATVGAGAVNKLVDGYTWLDTPTDGFADIDFMGSDTPHNTLMPFVALLYCQKD